MNFIELIHHFRDYYKRYSGMKIFYDIDKFKLKKFSGCSLAIGNFDGVHPGHQKIILSAVREAKSMNLKSGIFTFKHHPKNIIHNKKRLILY